MDLEYAVSKVIREEGLISGGETVLVGVSGGLDSATLLFILNRIKDRIPCGLAVAHVNHQLRGKESERDETFVRELAGKYDLPFHVTRADIRDYALRNGLSLQHAGRDVRYRYFDEICRSHGYSKIAIAHNRDDQVETFLLRVVKGTGINGLSSIPIKRGLIIRPLLRSYRAEIEAYAHHYSVAYVQDSSNLKDAYERNFIRNRVVPLLAEVNPRFREKILLLLSDIASVNRFFNEEAERFLASEHGLDEGDIRIGADALKALHPEVRFRVVSRVLSRLEPRFVALREHELLVEKSLFSKRPNNTVLLPHGIRVKRIYGDLVFTRKGPARQIKDTFAVHEGENDVPALGVTLHVSFTSERPETLAVDRNVAFFDAAGLSKLSVRTFREGDRFMPLGMDETVKLKDYFISRKIPREKRRGIPLLLSDGNIIWIVGQRMDERYKVKETTTRFFKVTARFSW